MVVGHASTEASLLWLTAVSDGPIRWHTTS